MATWIFILHMVFPFTSDLPATGLAPSTPDDTASVASDELVRYRGLEQMFARFEAEAT